MMMERFLGDGADYLLSFDPPKITNDRLHFPGPKILAKSARR